MTNELSNERGEPETAAGSRAEPALDSPVVLVIEDDAPTCKLLRALLGEDGYQVVEARTGADALARARAHNPDLVILDLGLPDIAGTAVARRLREWMRAPIIVLSARAMEADKVDAFEAGVNDYVTKPFGMRELLARARVWLRQSRVPEAPRDAVLEVGELRLDLGRRLAFVGGAEIHLTRKEYKLLAVLMRHAGRVVTHRQLLEEVWGPAYTRETQYLRVYVGQLRYKIERDPARPARLQTEPGVGYRLRAATPEKS